MTKTLPQKPAAPANGKTKRSVLIVDDHPIFRNGLSQLINEQPDILACGGVSSAPQALSAVEQYMPDLLIVDISIQGTDGIELMKCIRAQHPKLPALVVSSHDENIYAVRALRAGARGYLMKDAAPPKLIEAIRAILDGGLYVSEAIGKRLLKKLIEGSDEGESSFVSQLSDREIEVFRALGEGKSTREIAWALGLSQKTVETHRAHLKKKLNVQTASELVRAAVEWVTKEGTHPPANAHD